MATAGRFTLLLALVAWLTCSRALAQPNIIHLIADDLGWADLSEGATNYGNGSGYYETPNIDALAAKGMSFTSAYAQQNCQPTRAALLTGQYAPRNGVHNVGSLNRAGDDTLLVGPADGDSVKTNAITVAETLRSAGYSTAYFGKFHVAAARNDITTQHGYDLNMELANGASGEPHQAAFVGGSWTLGQPSWDAYAQPYTQAYIDERLAPFANGNNPNSLVGTAKHQTDAIADAVGDYVASHASGSSPFFMSVGFNAVHTAITPRPDLAAKYNALPSTDPRHTNQAYAGFVETLDQAVGRIMASIEDPNGDGDTADSIAANTLIVFSSDNGGHMGPTNNAPLRERKGTLREGGVRVPLIAALPGTIAAGSTNDEAVHAVDFYPTFAEMAGAALPAPGSHVLDGESFAPILKGQQSALQRDAIYWHFPGYLDTRAVPTSVITKDIGDQRYKLSYFYEDQSYELFNLTADLSEATNLLSGAVRATDFHIATQLSQDLIAWLQSQNATYPTVRATGAAVPPPAPLMGLPSSEPMQATFQLTDASLQGKVTHQLMQDGLTMTLTAVGSGAVLDRSSNGLGVLSAGEAGTATIARRINGTLPSPESIQFSFDRDVTLNSIVVGAIHTGGAETLRLAFVSGDNPFAGLNGYTGDYQVTASSLNFRTTSGAATPLSISFGAGGQEALMVAAGTVLSITANPAEGNGILFNSISVETSGSVPGDFNRDGIIDGADLDIWAVNYGATAAINVSGDSEGDGDIDGSDFLLWQRRLSAGAAAIATPEPATGVLLLCLASLLPWARRR